MRLAGYSYYAAQSGEKRLGSSATRFLCVPWNHSLLEPQSSIYPVLSYQWLNYNKINSQPCRMCAIKARVLIGNEDSWKIGWECMEIFWWNCGQWNLNSAEYSLLFQPHLRLTLLCLRNLLWPLQDLKNIGVKISTTSPLNLLIGL